MAKKANKQLTELYCNTYIDAAFLGDYKLCKHLSRSRYFDRGYVRKQQGHHILESAARIGDDETFLTGFAEAISSGNMLGLDLLNTVIAAAHSGNMKIIEAVNESVDKFGDYKDVQYNYNCALREASERGHAKAVDFFISKGAKPNDWHVLRWSAADAPGNTYRKILRACDLDPKSSRKIVIEFCHELFEQKPADWSTIDINKLKEYLNTHKQ